MPNREIKFRVWDIDNNEWGNPDYLECGDGGKLMYFGHSPNREKFIIQQFTGLPDKTGKEIYEGDLVRLWDWNKYGDDYCYGKVSEVKYNYGEFYWYNPIKLDTDTISSSVEIIGNIFQNPELLKETK